LWKLAIAAVVLLAVGIGFGDWWAGNRRAARLDSNGEPKPVDDVPSPQPLGAVVATVAGNSGTRLQHENGTLVPAAIGNDVRTGRYVLRGGVLELNYESGTTIILESPATVELQSDDHVMLVSGRISVRCPTEESQGFVVETPSGVAIDLGTEFAVEVDQNGMHDDEYHVFTGKVVVEKSGKLGRVTLQQGQALRLDHRTSTPAGIDVDHQRFIRGFDATSTHYYDQILKLDPAVYYVMRPEPDGRTLRNEMSEDSVATIYSSVDDHLTCAPGFNGGTAFHLNGVHSQTYAFAQDYPKSQDDRLSVVAWVYAESRPIWASIAKNWQHGVEPERRGQFHFGLHKLSGVLEAHVNDNDNVEQFALEAVPFPLDRWHHVAMVADGAVLRLYRNGKEVAATAYNGLNGNPAIKELAIGSKLGDDIMKPAVVNAGFWDGRIDHLAIFNGALTPDQIQKLYEVGDASVRESRHAP
jgi:hypothetical protein